MKDYDAKKNFNAPCDAGETFEDELQDLGFRAGKHWYRCTYVTYDVLLQNLFQKLVRSKPRFKLK